MSIEKIILFNCTERVYLTPNKYIANIEDIQIPATIKCLSLRPFSTQEMLNEQPMVFLDIHQEDTYIYTTIDTENPIWKQYDLYDVSFQLVGNFNKPNEDGRITTELTYMYLTKHDSERKIDSIGKQIENNQIERLLLDETSIDK